ASGETILTPLAFYPWFLWTIDDARAHPSLVRLAETRDADTGDAPPDWVLYVPGAFIRDEARTRVATLLNSGLYTPVVAGADDVGALYVRRDRATPLARLAPTG